MAIATISSRGRVTVPVSVRAALGLQAGCKVNFVRVGDAFEIVPVHTDRQSLKGRFAGRVVKPVTLPQMEAAMAEVAKRRM